MEKQIQDSLYNLKIIEEKRKEDSILYSEKNIQYPRNNPIVLHSFLEN